MAFGRRLEKTHKARPGLSNPSPGYPIANPAAQPSDPLTIRPHPIPTQRRDGGNHTYPSPPATTCSPNPGWGQSATLNHKTQVTAEAPEPCWEQTLQGPALGDLIASKFDAVLTSIDNETFNGDERELGA